MLACGSGVRLLVRGACAVDRLRGLIVVRCPPDFLSSGRIAFRIAVGVWLRTWCVVRSCGAALNFAEFYLAENIGGWEGVVGGEIVVDRWCFWG